MANAPRPKRKARALNMLYVPTVVAGQFLAARAWRDQCGSGYGHMRLPNGWCGFARAVPAELVPAKAGEREPDITTDRASVGAPLVGALERATTRVALPTRRRSPPARGRRKRRADHPKPDRDVQYVFTAPFSAR